MATDILTALVGFLSFFLFLFAQAISYRRQAPDRMFSGLKTLVMVFAGLPLALTAALCAFKVVNISWQGGVLMASLSFLIQGLLCFFYVLTVFGAYETSVRMRLLREIASAGPEGLSEGEILQRYNPETITRLRLGRLAGAGYIIEQGGSYRLSASPDLFFIFALLSSAGKILAPGK